MLVSGNLATIPVTKRVGDLAPGLRQSLDIARAVALADRLDIPDPVILFDEPATALDQSHEENFLHLLERLRGGAGVVFVSHRLGEVLRSCDRVVVLKDGDLVTDQPVQGLTEPDLHRLMVGRERGANYYFGDLQNGAQGGIAVLIVRDDLPELIGLSDRILVMVEGRITRDIAAPPPAKPAEAEIVSDMIPAGLPRTAIPSAIASAPLTSLPGNIHV